MERNVFIRHNSPERLHAFIEASIRRFERQLSTWYPGWERLTDADCNLEAGNGRYRD